MLQRVNLLTVVLLSSLSILGMATLDMYLPALPAITHDLHSDPQRIQLTVSLYTMILGLGQLFFGPMVDFFGRRPILFCALPGFCLATLGCYYAETASWLIIMRCLQAFCACATSVVAFAGTRDIDDDLTRARLMSYLTMTISISPILAPIAGAYILSLWNWRSIFLVILGFAVMELLFVARCLKESPHTNPHPRLAFVAPYKAIVCHKDYWLYTLSGIFSFSALVVFIINSPFLLITFGGVDPTQYSLLFALNSSMVMVGAYVGIHLRRALGIDNTIKLGGLLIMLSGAGLSLLLAWDVSAYLVILPVLLMTFGALTVMPTAATAALTPFPGQAASAAALMNGVRFSVAGIVGSGVGAVFADYHLSLAFAFIILGGLTIIPMLWRYKAVVPTM